MVNRKTKASDLIIVTGLSGAGKTQTVNSLEDMGYYCIDNLPPALMGDFLKLISRDNRQQVKAAFVIDIRGGEFFDDLISGLDALDKENISYKILFLEASDQTLIRRFKETRRQHPMRLVGTLTEGITSERKKLEEIRQRAHWIIDTSNLKTAQLSNEIRELLSGNGEQTFGLTIMSFGFKNGIPLEVDTVFDLRFLPNPFYLDSLKKMTGNNKKVRDYVLRFPEANQFLDSVFALVRLLIPGYVREGKTSLVVAFGCTGGQHRSVVMANEFSKLCRADGRHVLTIHRDLPR